MKLYATEVEAVDDCNALLFIVRAQDTHSAAVTLHQAVHTAESWRELADGVTQALEMLALEVAQCTDRRHAA